MRNGKSTKKDSKMQQQQEKENINRHRGEDTNGDGNIDKKNWMVPIFLPISIAVSQKPALVRAGFFSFKRGCDPPPSPC